MHNAEKPNPPASVRDTGGQGELLASSNTRARNSLRAVATHNAPSPGVHGEESKPVAHPCRGPGGQAGDYQKRKGHPPSGVRETWLAPNVQSSCGTRHLPPPYTRLRLYPTPSSATRTWGPLCMRYMLRNATFLGFFEILGNRDFDASS